MSKRMGHSQAQLTRNARAFGQPTGSPHDLFYATWAAVRTRYELSEGAERDRWGEILIALQDEFDNKSH